MKNLNYSIVMPIYERSEIIRRCFLSIKRQTILPEEIIFIDNNTKKKESQKLSKIIKNCFNEENFKVYLIKSEVNSSSIARNIGAEKSKSNLIAFLDSDVVLRNDYYEILLGYFKKYPDLIAIQGIDEALVESCKNIKNLSLPFKLLHYFEQIFETSSLLNRDKAYVSPSMAVAHPKLSSEFEIDTEWISTCAGVFKKYLFTINSFPENFVTYSNNEYIYFSYYLFKLNEGKMIYTSKARYTDIQTQFGRINKIPLLYQIEVNDLYLFLKFFNKGFKNRFIFFVSRIGHFVFNLMKYLYKRKLSLTNIFHIFYSLLYPFLNFQKIKKGDLSFYEKDFPIEK